MQIIHTDNFGGDYPNEKIVTGLPWLNEEQAEKVAKCINECLPANAPRFYRAVTDDYELQPGFTP